MEFIAPLIVFFYILILVLCVVYIIVVPYFIAKHFRITDDLAVDCVISYISTLGLGLLGNLGYIVISLVIQNQKKKQA
jgi:hypothetical protein